MSFYLNNCLNFGKILRNFFSLPFENKKEIIFLLEINNCFGIKGKSFTNIYFMYYQVIFKCFCSYQIILTFKENVLQSVIYNGNFGIIIHLIMTFCEVINTKNEIFQIILCEFDFFIIC